MRSVADVLRSEERRAVRALSPAERVRLALSLGRRDFEAFCAGQRDPLTADAAARALERRRQVGRRPSRCVLETIG